MSKKEITWLIIIFVIACSFRLFFVFGTPYFSSTDSYLNLRIAENLREDIVPDFHDTLSYGGRTLLYSPVFHYIFYALTPFVNLEIAAKLFSSIMISLLVIPVFLISKKLTNHTKISLITSFLSIFIPANILFTFNTFTPYSIMVPLIFFTIYFLMDIKKYTTHFIVASVLGSTIHPSFLLLIIGFILYLVLIKVAGFEADRAKLEAVLFSTILTFWILLIVYKNAFLLHGLSVVWQNIPQQILRHYFSGTNILEAIYMIGLVPLLTGIYVLYKYISSRVKREAYILISFAVSVVILTVLHMLSPDIGLAFTGIILTIFFSVFLLNFWNYLLNARFKLIRILLTAFVLTALIFTNIIPSLAYIQKSLQDSSIEDTHESLQWISKNTNPEDTILSSLEEGHLVTFFAKRPSVIDENFLYQQDASIRLDDVNSIYRTSYSTEAIPLLNKYDAKYIMFTPETSKRYNIQSLKFLNKNCFELAYDKEVKIYKSLCRMDVQ